MVETVKNVKAPSEHLWMLSLKKIKSLKTLKQKMKTVGYGRSKHRMAESRHAKICMWSTGHANFYLHMGILAHKGKIWLTGRGGR